MDEEPKSQGKDETEYEGTEHYQGQEKWREERNRQDKSNYDNSYKLMFKLMLLLNSGGIVILVTNFLPKFTGESIPLCYSILMTVILVIFSGGLGCAFFIALRDFVLCRRVQSESAPFDDEVTSRKIGYDEFYEIIKALDDDTQNKYKYNTTINRVGVLSFVLGFSGSILLLMLTSFLIFQQ